jgi:predicted transcriptional regulator
LQIEVHVLFGKMMPENTTVENPVTSEPDPVVALTARIVAAYVVKHTVPTAQVPDLITQTFRALKCLGQEPVASEVPEIKKPAVSIRQSITDDYLVSLEDGRKFKSLKRHLMSEYGMTPAEYRSKWGLRSDYPMVAPNYSAKRSELAKESGLGNWWRELVHDKDEG